MVMEESDSLSISSEDAKTVDRKPSQKVPKIKFSPNTQEKKVTIVSIAEQFDAISAEIDKEVEESAKKLDPKEKFLEVENKWAQSARALETMTAKHKKSIPSLMNREAKKRLNFYSEQNTQNSDEEAVADESAIEYRMLASSVPSGKL